MEGFPSGPQEHRTTPAQSSWRQHEGGEQMCLYPEGQREIEVVLEQVIKNWGTVPPFLARRERNEVLIIEMVGGVNLRTYLVIIRQNNSPCLS